MCMCIMEHACLIRRDEVYLARIPHCSAGADRRGLLLLAAFPLLSPLPLPHPPPFTLGTVWNSFPSGCSHHHISILLTQPSFSVVWQASVLPSFSSLSVFVSCWRSRRQGTSLQEGVSVHRICWVERWVSAFPAGAPETVGHRWCRLHPPEQRQDSVRRAACTSGRALCWEQTEERRQAAAAEGGKRVARGARVIGALGRWVRGLLRVLQKWKEDLRSH